MERITQMLLKIQEYLLEGNPYDAKFWICPAIAIMLTWLLSLILSKAIKTPKGTQQTFNIFRQRIIAASVATGIIIAIGCYGWSHRIFEHTPIQFSILISLIIAMFIAVSAFFRLRSLSEERRNLFTIALTKEQDNEAIVKIKQLFTRLKLWMLLPLIGFTVLGFARFGNNLLSVVVDTSLSMNQQPFFSDFVPMETARNALMNTVKELDSSTDIIITTFEAGEPKKSVSELLNIQTSESALGFDIIFDGKDKEGAINYISTIDVVDVASPVCEAIRSNILYAKENQSNKLYNDVAMIIITDGKELGVPKEELSTFFCNEENYNEVFSADRIFTINLSQSLNEFMNQNESCGFTVMDGTSLNSYESAIEDIISPFKRDWAIIFWMALLYFIIFLIILSVQSKT